jgi:hypothetical protein
MATKKKHPKDMTTDEALKHLFHPKIVKHLRSQVAKSNALTKRKKTTK